MWKITRESLPKIFKIQTTINLPGDATIHNHVGDYIGGEDVGWGYTQNWAPKSMRRCDRDAVHAKMYAGCSKYDVAKPGFPNTATV